MFFFDMFARHVEVNRYMVTVVVCVFYLDSCPCLAEGRWVVSGCSGAKVDFFCRDGE